ncbi:MAG: methyltransferase domain-containing protein [Caenibius sp.]
MLMTARTPPTIFSRTRRHAVRMRAQQRRQRPDAARYLIDDMVEDVADRLSFLRFEPRNALVIGDIARVLANVLAQRGAQVTSVDPAGPGDQSLLDEERPWPFGGFDLIASLGTLDTVNDLPGALLHLRNALAEGGLMIACLPGAGSLPVLRSALLAAEAERPAARMHPMVDVRAGGQLLQRCGFARPVVDSRALTVRFGSLSGLVRDLRDQALTSVLASTAPPLTRAVYRRAEAAFMAQADDDRRVSEHFELLTLSGWKP